MRLRISTAVLLLLLSFSCSTGPDTGLSVRVSVRRGPIAPISREGEDNTAPVAGARVTVTRGGLFVTTAGTDAGGEATLTLQPGSYVATVTECPGALALPGPAAFAVAGDTTSVRLKCDTGIR